MIRMLKSLWDTVTMAESYSEGYKPRQITVKVKKSSRTYIYKFYSMDAAIDTLMTLKSIDDGFASIESAAYWGENCTVDLPWIPLP